MTTSTLQQMLQMSKTIYYIGYTASDGCMTSIAKTKYYDNYDEAWDAMKKIQPSYKHRLEVFKW